MKRFLGLTIGMLLVASATSASVPTTISIQGRLQNNGMPVSGTHYATFRIFDAVTTGNQLWSEDDTLTVTNGIYSTVIGNNVPLSTAVFTGAPCWLETVVDGTLLTPRLSLATNPYAFRSQRADTANVALSGGSESDLWSTDGVNVWRIGGNVGIGTATPLRPFMVERDLNGDWLVYFHNMSSSGHGLLIQSGETNSDRIAAFQDRNGNDRFSFYSGGRFNIMGSLGIGPATPWSSDGIYLDAGSQQSTIAWDNRANAGFQMYQVANSNIFNFTSSGGGSGESWNFISAGLGNLFSIGSTITSNRNLQVNGSMTATGTKCRAVEGTKYGTLYYNAVESGNAIFTTSGRAKLRHGKAHIELDPKWRAGVTINHEHPVDVTSVTFYGPHGTWYARPSGTGFDLIESTGANVEFFWSVQAAQKGYEEMYLNHVEQSAAK